MKHQRPRLTNKTAEALTTAVTYLSGQWWADDQIDKERDEQIKRGIEYLESLLRWHRFGKRDK